VNTFITRTVCLLVLWSIVGCEPAEITIKKKESYADLVVIYNAEVQSLERLENKRKEVLASIASRNQEDAVKALAGSLGSLGAGATSGNPNDALDKAVAAAEAQAKLLNQAANNSSQASMSEEDKAKLAEIDAEIAKQRERVEKAKAARDAAEANR
jgi:hypothetical protein